MRTKYWGRFFTRALIWRGLRAVDRLEREQETARQRQAARELLDHARGRGVVFDRQDEAILRRAAHRTLPEAMAQVRAALVTTERP
jgi:hypothetical protein